MHFVEDVDAALLNLASGAAEAITNIVDEPLTMRTVEYFLPEDTRLAEVVIIAALITIGDAIDLVCRCTNSGSWLWAVERIGMMIGP